MRILIIEDDRSALAAMRVYLENQGHAICACDDPERALAAAQRFRPGLLIADWNLEHELDGVEVVRRIQAQLDAPAVFITGSNTARLRACSDDLRVAACLQKPLDLAELAALANSS